MALRATKAPYRTDECLTMTTLGALVVDVEVLTRCGAEESSRATLDGVALLQQRVQLCQSFLVRAGRSARFKRTISWGNLSVV
jgi:hypothetical protein